MYFRATPPSIRSHGSAETGVLQRHYSPLLTTPTNHARMSLEDSIREETDGDYSDQATPPRKVLNNAFTTPRTMTKRLSDSSLTTPTATPTARTNFQALTPNRSICGGQRSHTPRSGFPLNVQTATDEQQNHSTPSNSAPSNSTSAASSSSALFTSTNNNTLFVPVASPGGNHVESPPSDRQSLPRSPDSSRFQPLQQSSPAPPLTQHSSPAPPLAQQSSPAPPTQYSSPAPPTQHSSPAPPTQHSSPAPPTLPLQPLVPPSSLGRINLESSNPHYRVRALSIFEEESETESIPEPSQQSRQLSTSPSHHSPVRNSGSPHLNSPRSRSRKLSNARSSPNLFASVSKSDISEDDDEEDEDDIVELMTTSGRFPNKSTTFPRTSPSNSPLLTSRCSPTHYLTGGSSEEESGNVFETARKNRNKRHPFRKRSIPKLVRVDSISSDDGKSPRDQAPPTRKGRLLRLRQYNSLPATPAEHSASDSLTDILESFRRKQTVTTTTSSNVSVSGRTDSSVSDSGSRGATGDRDMGELASSIVAKFELSDEDGLQGSTELDHSRLLVSQEHQPAESRGPGHNTCSSLTSMDVSAGLVHTQSHATLRSIFCSIL